MFHNTEPLAFFNKKVRFNKNSIISILLCKIEIFFHFSVFSKIAYYLYIKGQRTSLPLFLLKEWKLNTPLGGRGSFQVLNNN